MALPNPPSVNPGGGGSLVKTAGVRRGRPFCRTRTTIEKSGTSVRKERMTQTIVQRLLPRIRLFERVSCAFNDSGLKPVVKVTMLMDLANAGCCFFSPMKHCFSNHVNQ